MTCLVSLPALTSLTHLAAQNLDLLASVPFVAAEPVPFALIVMFPRLVELEREAIDDVELDEAPIADVVLVPVPPAAPFPFFPLFFPPFFPSFLPFLPFLSLSPLPLFLLEVLPVPALVPLPASSKAVEPPDEGAGAASVKGDAISDESARRRKAPGATMSIC